MKTEDLHHYKQRLLAMRQRLQDQFATIEEAIVEDLARAGDLSHVPLHNADHDSEGLDADVAVARTEIDLMREVENALRRIEDGTYGTCQTCGRAIKKERLNALPQTPFCVRCEEEQEESADATRET